MIESITAYHVSMPMRWAFGHAARETRATAENVVVRVTLDGASGIGECVPRDYVTGETVASVFAALRTFDPHDLDAVGAASTFESAVRELDKLTLPRVLERGTTRGLAASCAIDLAILDALCRKFEQPLSQVAAIILDSEISRSVQVRIPEYFDFSQSTEAFLDSVRSTPAHVKIKVGRDVETDSRRVGAVRAALGPGVRIVVDANMAWTSDALATVRALQVHDVGWFEEPVAQHDYETCAALRSRTSAKIMLDESLCSFADATKAIERSACDLFNIRLSKCGGILGALNLVKLARAHGLQYQLGVHVGESGILWAAGLQLTSALHDAATFEVGMPDRFFDRTLTKEPTTTDWTTRMATVPTGHGLGVTADMNAIEAAERASARWVRSRGSWQ